MSENARSFKIYYDFTEQLILEKINQSMWGRTLFKGYDVMVLPFARGILWDSPQLLSCCNVLVYNLLLKKSLHLFNASEKNNENAKMCVCVSV